MNELNYDHVSRGTEDYAPLPPRIISKHMKPLSSGSALGINLSSFASFLFLHRQQNKQRNIQMCVLVYQESMLLQT